MSLWPKEHGAYGQVAFPLATALLVAGPSLGGVLLALVVVAGFFAHEPAAVLWNLRGPHARRQLGPSATRWLAACLALASLAGIAAAWTVSPATRLALAVPAIPALGVAWAMLEGREKSWYGETAAAFAFSGSAVPVVMAAGRPFETALGVALPFALLFVSTTLAVRVVVLRVRGGRDPRAADATRAATLILTTGSLGLLAALAWLDAFPSAFAVAAAPGLVAAGSIALRPPSPARLRWVGWTLVGVSIATAALVVRAAV